MKKNGEQSKPELVKALYLRGTSHREISAVTGLGIKAIQKRINRGKWRKLKDDATKAVTERKLSVEECGDLAKQGMAVEMVGTVENLQKIKHSNDLAKTKVRAEILNTLAAGGEKVFGWNSPGSGPNTTFNTFNFTAKTVGPINPPIDVPSLVNGATIIDIPTQTEDGNGS